MGNAHDIESRLNPHVNLVARQAKILWAERNFRAYP
jgi:hypothetical protein